MIPEYKSIIEKRENFIQKNLKWDSHFSVAIRKSMILAQRDLEEIEKESQEESRAYHLARKLLEQTNPLVFNKFCILLEETRNEKIANTLMDDRDKVEWDFQQEGFAANSVAYMSVMEDQLIRRMDTEADPHVRDRIWQELCSRLAKLKVTLREDQHQRERFRESLLKMCASAGTDAKPRRKISASKLLSHDAELEDEAYVLNKVKETVRKYQRELAKYQKALDAATDQSRDMDILSQCSNLSSEKSKVDMLSKIVKEQDIKIMWMQEDMKQKMEDNYMIKKGKVISMLDYMLSRQESRMCNVHDDVKDDDIPDIAAEHTTALFKLVDQAEDKVDKLKKRLQQISDRVSELEMERGVVMKMLDIHPTPKLSLPDAADARLKSFRQTEEDLEVELESLRKRIASLGEENRCLANRLESGKVSPTPSVTQSVKATASAKRRSSAPHKPAASGGLSTPKPGKPRRTSVVTY